MAAAGALRHRLCIAGARCDVYLRLHELSPQESAVSDQHSIMTGTSEAEALPPGGAGSQSAASRPVEARSLKTNAVWTIAGNGVYAANQWLQVAIIAHLGTTVDVGHYALIMGICAPVFMLANLQLRAIQATDSIQ